MSGLTLAPDVAVDPTKAPDNAVVQTRVDTGGRTQVRVQFTPAPPVDPADPKPAVEAPKPDAAKVEDKPADAEVAPQRPTWLPEKFATPQALKDATVELAKKQGAPGYVIAGLIASESGQEVSDAYKGFEKQIDPNAGKPAEKVEEAPKAEEKPSEEKPAERPAKSEEVKKYERETFGTYVAEMLDKAGFSSEEIGNEFVANGGKLTDKTFEAFEKAGVSRTFLTSYVRGQVAGATEMAQAEIKEAKDSIGGEAVFTQVAVWANANMTKEQHEIYSSLTNSRSLVAAKEGVRMLKGWYDAANGKAPKLIVPNAPTVVENKGYESRQQMMKDMNDPRYTKGDKAFHKEVETKLKYTNFN